MTNFSEWDKKAAALVKEAEEEDATAKDESDKALGLTEPPKGPPTVKAERQMNDLRDHSQNRKEFIDWSNSREVSLMHTASDEPIELSAAELHGKAVRLSGSEDVRYVIPAGYGFVKLMVEKCKRVQISIEGNLLTSTVELYNCDDLVLELFHPLGSLQVDECSSAIHVRYAEREHIGKIFHQNSPGLALGWAVMEPVDFFSIGEAEQVQLITSLAPLGATKPLMTAPVVRGEGEYPIDLFAGMGHRVATDAVRAGHACVDASDVEAAERKHKAEEKRLAGNDMFRANDFMQAALQYTEALGMDPEMSTVWANRAQCWLRLGDPEKALADAIKCTDIDSQNSKGWFRKGMSLHAMKRFPEAIPAFVEAEKLEPNNKQIPEAIQMSQLMARKQAAGA